MRPEIIIILQALDNKNQAVVDMEKKTGEILNERQDPQHFIDFLIKEIRQIKDIHDDQTPFLYFHLSIAYLKQKRGKEAKDALANAIFGFRIRGFSLNEAMGEWLFGVIHLENSINARAQRACETAIAILRKLVRQCEDESKYGKAEEYADYLMLLEKFGEEIKDSRSAKERKDPITIPINSDLPREYASHQEIEGFKAMLRHYHRELTRIYEYLKAKKTRIPPTLVATMFYIYKALTPSHSVYSTVPHPKTTEEKKIYEELIKKIGFFEVIEQLVNLELDHKPTADREEILKKINLEWDKDINMRQESN